jgi:phosphatidylserine/phosphatidylglycerophosphate/cardiolipin synthase-like enzyme
MPSFLSTREVVSHLERIISTATKSITLVTPYISFVPNSLIIRLETAIERGVQVRLIYRYENKIHYNEKLKLNVLKGVKLYCNENLHAKAYFNDTDAVVTSFNLSGASEVNNIEFGIHFTISDSTEMFNRLRYETNLIIKESKSIDLAAFVNVDESRSRATVNGYCIRCGDEIQPDPEKPFCFTCFLVWKDFENVNYPEKYCHLCGETASTTMAEPICSKHSLTNGNRQ